MCLTKGREIVKFKTIEEIRADTGMNQKDFSSVIGAGYRSYQGRLYGESSWLLEEVVKAAELNKGYITLRCLGKMYDITVKERED